MAEYLEVIDRHLIDMLGRFEFLNELAEEQIQTFARGKRCMFRTTETEKDYFMGHTESSTRFLVLQSDGNWRVVLREGRERELQHIRGRTLHLTDQTLVLNEFIDGKRDLFKHSSEIIRMFLKSGDDGMSYLFLYPNRTFDFLSMPQLGEKFPVQSLRKKQRKTMSDIGRWLASDASKHWRVMNSTLQYVSEQSKKGLVDAAQYAFLKAEKEFMLICAACKRFNKKQALTVTNKADKLLEKLQDFKKNAENLLQEAKELLKPLAFIDWPSVQQHELDRSAEDWARSLTFEVFRAQPPYCVVDGNNVAHSSIEGTSTKVPFCSKRLLQALYQLARVHWFPHAVIKDERRENYSDGFKNLIDIGMVSVTNRDDHDDDAHVVDYAMNLGLLIISNGLYRDLVHFQATAEAGKRLFDYLELYQYKFNWHASYFHVHRRRSYM